MPPTGAVGTCTAPSKHSGKGPQKEEEEEEAEEGGAQSKARQSGSGRVVGMHACRVTARQEVHQPRGAGAQNGTKRQ